MQLLTDAFNKTDLPRGGVVGIGNFDGVHRGQRSLLAQVAERAAELGVPAVAVSFDPHPLRVLRPDSAPPLLVTREQKARLMEELGLDALLLIRFDAGFARVTAEDFVRQFLHRALGACEVWVGETFRFGWKREGDLERLRSLAAELDFRAEGLPEVRDDGDAISSSRIRDAILEGDVEAATRLLGRPYAVTGVISRGDRMGKRLGWPTINLEPHNELLPEDGVYVGRVTFPSFPATFDCVTNIGTRPTVYENYRRVVESHILDFRNDVYGEAVEIEFHKRLRDERIFPSIMDLSAQIGRDVEAAREHFAAERRLASELELSTEEGRSHGE